MDKIILTVSNTIYFTLIYIINKNELFVPSFTFNFRGYSTKKLQNNVECEIFQTLLEEAMESYDNNIVHELRNETYADMERNITHIGAWVNQWIKDNVNK